MRFWWWTIVEIAMGGLCVGVGCRDERQSFSAQSINERCWSEGLGTKWMAYGLWARMIDELEELF